MKVLVLVLLAIILIASKAEVIEVSTANWDEVIGKANHSLVSFTASWCGHCKALHPEYKKLAESYTDDKIVIANFECTEDDATIPSRYEVRGFPTIILFQNGNVQATFTGERNADELQKWLTKKVVSPVTTFQPAHELKNYLVEAAKKATTVVVGYFDESKGDSRDAYIKTATHPESEEFEFVEIIGSEHKQGESEDHIVLHRHFNHKPIVHTFFDNILDFVKTEGYPLVPNIADVYQRVVSSDKLTAILFIDPSKDNNQTLSQVEHAAEQLKGRVTFAQGDGITYARYAENLGVKLDQLPRFVTIYFKQGKKYIPEEHSFDITSHQIVLFCNQVLDGNIQPNIRSEPTPVQNADSPVVQLVGSTFEEKVMNDAENDILVYFYAEWCEACKTFDPKYEQLGGILQNVDSLLVTKIDASKNDLPFDIADYPLFALFTSNNKLEPPVYGGKRNVFKIVEFLKEKAVASKDNLNHVVLNEEEYLDDEEIQPNENHEEDEVGEDDKVDEVDQDDEDIWEDEETKKDEL